MNRCPFRIYSIGAIIMIHGLQTDFSIQRSPSNRRRGVENKIGTEFAHLCSTTTSVAPPATPHCTHQYSIAGLYSAIECYSRQEEQKKTFLGPWSSINMFTSGKWTASIHL
ncbi:hypothetical protein BDW22DRAFT_329446 [Trametopsis cervina]|nr:hypothetical protein BDW22DRAFT_329446 [Trametopsis cervina]